MKQILKKRFLCSLFFLVFLCAFFGACGAPSDIISSISIQKERHSFDRYTDKLFAEEMQQNTINLHYTLVNPEDFGIKSHKISLGSLSKESRQANAAAIENISAALGSFCYEQLSTKQRLTYDVLKDYCEKEQKVLPLYYYQEPLRPTTGTQAELPVLLAEYDFHDACDVTEYLSLLTCIEDYFRQIVQFEREKSDQGLFMPDYAAKTVIEACRTFTADPERNFLIDTFNTRIDALSDLSEDKKEHYKKQNQSLVENAVVPAYEMLISCLEDIAHTGTNDGGLFYLPEGKTYYEYLVRSSTGSDKTVKELQARTERQRNLDIAALHDLLTKNPGLADSTDPALAVQTPDEMLKHLLEAMQRDFLPAPDDSYEINYIHESLEDTLAPAFYLTAPLDDISRNVIYLNKKSQYHGIQLFTTLAHEGYPGHLYQTTGTYQAGFTPVRALLNYPGYVEGWATYVEMLSYQYAGFPADVAEMLMHNQASLLSLYATIDMGIHYDGWKVPETTAFLNSYGITDNNTIQRIYELVVEEPAHYLKYYIGYLEFLELKNNAKKLLGDDYSDRSFHQAVIRIGPAPFPALKKYLCDFYTPGS